MFFPPRLRYAAFFFTMYKKHFIQAYYPAVIVLFCDLASKYLILFIILAKICCD